MATELITTPGATNANSYGTLEAYRSYVLGTYNVRLRDTPPTATGRPASGSQLTTNRDFFERTASNQQTLNAGSRHSYRAFTPPGSITTGASVTDDGVVIGTEGIYSAELSNLQLTVSDCEAGTLTVRLVVASDTAGEITAVESDIELPATTSDQPYVATDIEMRQRTLPAGSHMFIQIAYASTASGADCQYTLGSGQLSLTRFNYTGGTPGAGATSGVTVDSPAAQCAQLQQAAQVLQTFQWKYMPLMADQRLQFPVSIDGVSSGIPPKLIEAQFKIANAIREGKVGLHSGSASDRNETIRNQGTVTRYGLPGVSIERRTGLVTSSISDHIGTTNDELQSNWPDLHILLREYLDDTSVAGEGSWAR